METERVPHAAESRRLMEEMEPLVSAQEMETRGILKKSSAYKLAKRGAIPSYGVGPNRTGVRFRVTEVLAALRRPASTAQAVTLGVAK